jgi:hypothetical protein
VASTTSRRTRGGRHSLLRSRCWCGRPAVGLADHRSAVKEWDEFKVSIEIAVPMKTRVSRCCLGASRLPDGPLITHDDQVVELTGEDLVVTWDEVTSDFRGGGLGSAIVGYILTVTYETEILGESVQRELTIDVIPPDKFSAAIPADFLEPGTEVEIEVAAREESGNRTSREIFIDVVDELPND